jgi:hypothetical protein
VRNFLAIAALHEASTLAVSLPLAVVNGPRCKLARSYGVLSLIYLPTEANIPILEAGRIFEIVPKRGSSPAPTLSIEPLASRRFQPCRDECLHSFFTKKFLHGRFCFSQNFMVGRWREGGVMGTTGASRV